MLPVKPEAVLYLVVGAEQVECGVLAGGAWVDGSVRQLPCGQASRLAGVLDDIAASLAEAAMPRARRVQAIVADIWLASLTMPWSVEQRGTGARGYALAQLADGGAAVEDADLVRIDAAPPGQARLVFAYPAALIDGLERLAQRAGAPLASVLPCSVAAWTAQRGPQQGAARALGLCDQRMLLVCHGTTRLDAVTARTSAAGIEGLHGLWDRMQLCEPHLAKLPALTCLDLSETAPLCRLQLAASVPRRASALDAVADRPQPAVLRWVLAVAAMGCAAVAVAQAAQQVSATRVLQQQWAARPVRASVASAGRIWQRDELEKVRSVNRAVATLNLPVAAMLFALRPPADIGVVLLSVELAGGADQERPVPVTIRAQAGSGAEMARYVAFVGEQKPFHSAVLLEHELNNLGPERVYRFTLEAQWSE